MNIPSFSNLKKYCKQTSDNHPQYKLAVLGDCATQHLATALKGYAQYAGFPMQVFDADYNQLDAQIMDPQSELYQFAPDGVLIYLCTEKLLAAYWETPLQSRELFAQQMYRKISRYWQTLAAHGNISVLQFDFVTVDDGIFGSYAWKTAASFPFQLRKLKYLLAEGCQEHKTIFLVDIDSLQMQVGRSRFFEEKMYYVAKMPISLECLPEAAKRVVDVICALRGQSKKCVITDLDNTLWGGVIGDDGLQGVQIGELGGGPAFTHLQHWLKALKDRGILLAVCSKNNEETAKEVFEKHPEMVLRLEDFAAFTANWEDKASNIRSIQQTLNIGMDSLVFLDDNPFEPELVRSLLPEVTVPELPEDPAEYVSYLTGLNLFETGSFSAQDADRTRQYREEAARTELLQSFGSYEAYLSGLEMKAVSAPFDPFHYPRIAQLTQRSNQFNLRTVRYTEAQIEELAGDPAHITRYYTLRDNMGDHGLISVVVLDKKDPDTLFISEWLMSCRVLKRGMEEFIVNDLVKIAGEHGYSRLVGEYIKTPKNSMVADLYLRMGFEAEGDVFVARPEMFRKLETRIEEEAR